MRTRTTEEINADLLAMFGDLDDDWEYHLEGLKLDIAIAVTKYMDEQGISSAELARRMGVPPPVITRIRRHMGNVTLKTLAKLAVALGTEASITMKPRAKQVVAKKAVTKKKTANPKKRATATKRK